MRPQKSDYPEYFERYMQRVPEGNLTDLMKTTHLVSNAFIQGLSEEKLLSRYAPGKWSIKEILNHLIDGERIFSYRALRFARNDATELPGFEENDYAPASKADRRTAKSLLSEWDMVRGASITLFESLDQEMLARTGIASGKKISVNALGHIIVGHELHHMNVIKEKYL